jgi:hypothetical protein
MFGPADVFKYDVRVGDVEGAILERQWFAWLDGLPLDFRISRPVGLVAGHRARDVLRIGRWLRRYRDGTRRYR